MKVFRDLSIRGEPNQLAATLEAIEQSLTDGWARDRTTEGDVVGRASYFCFACSAKPNRPAAFLFLLQREQKLLKVTNIAPKEKHQLSHSEYNSLVEEFYQRFVQPAAEKVGVRAELAASEADLERWLSRDAAEKLRSFSVQANKSTGSAHPSDQDLWMEFVVAAHREGSRLDSTILRRWLIEDENWEPEVARQLAIEYEFGRDILAFADGHRRSA